MARYNALQYAKIDTAASGNTALVAAAGTGKKIVVRNYLLIASAAVSVKFRSANTDLTGAMALSANGGASAAGHPEVGWFETAANEALNINLSAAQQVSGHVSYTVETA